MDKLILHLTIFTFLLYNNSFGQNRDSSKYYFLNTNKPQRQNIQGRTFSIMTGTYNIIIDDNVSKVFDVNYCVLVGNNTNYVKGVDMQWLVDYNDSMLLKQPFVLIILKQYEKYFIHAGLDTKENRILMFETVSKALRLDYELNFKINN